MPLKKMEKQVWSTNFNYSACSLQFVSWNVQEERSSLLIRFCTTLCWGGGGATVNFCFDDPVEKGLRPLHFINLF